MDNHRTVWLSMGFYTMNHLHNTEHNVSMAADWLTLFNAELSPIEKKYWWAPRIQGRGKWKTTNRYTVATRMTPALSSVAMGAVLMFL